MAAVGVLPSDKANEEWLAGARFGRMLRKGRHALCAGLGLGHPDERLLLIPVEEHGERNFKFG
jgi:hypothetical protein